MGGEFAVVIHMELPFILACAFQELAESTFLVGLASGLGIGVPWPPCVVDGLEDAAWFRWLRCWPDDRWAVSGFLCWLYSVSMSRRLVFALDVSSLVILMYSVCSIT